MKTSHIIILFILVIVGLALFLSGEPKDEEILVPNDTAVIHEESDQIDHEDNVMEDTSLDEGGVSIENTTETVESNEGSVSVENIPAAVAPVKDSVLVENTTKPSTPVQVSEKVFAIDSFSFGYSVDEIKVKKGDKVTINLTNSGGFHDWVVDEFSAATEKINTGGSTSVTFTADKVGTFEFYCSVGSHKANGMVGKLIVE